MRNIKQQKLDELYKESIVTLVPSFCNEAFGRIIIESLLNGTQVISSPNCGANSFFKSEKFLQQHPLKLKSWINAIKEMTSNPYKITEEEVISIYDKFSMEKSKNDFKNLIKGLIT